MRTYTLPLYGASPATQDYFLTLTASPHPPLLVHACVCSTRLKRRPNTCSSLLAARKPAPTTRGATFCLRVSLSKTNCQQSGYKSTKQTSAPGDQPRHHPQGSISLPRPATSRRASGMIESPAGRSGVIRQSTIERATAHAREPKHWVSCNPLLSFPPPQILCQSA